MPKTPIIPKDVWITDGPNCAAALRKTGKGLELVFSSKGRNARKQVESYVALAHQGANKETVELLRESRLDSKSICGALIRYIDKMEAKVEDQRLL